VLIKLDGSLDELVVLDSIELRLFMLTCFSCGMTKYAGFRRLVEMLILLPSTFIVKIRILSNAVCMIYSAEVRRAQANTKGRISLFYLTQFSLILLLIYIIKEGKFYPLV